MHSKNSEIFQKYSQSVRKYSLIQYNGNMLKYILKCYILAISSYMLKYLQTSKYAIKLIFKEYIMRYET